MTKNIGKSIALAVVAAWAGSTASGNTETPTMGWSSWNTFRPQARVVKKDADSYVLLRDLSPAGDCPDGASVALAFLNLSDSPREMTFKGSGHLLGIDKKRICRVRELISGEDFASQNADSITVPAQPQGHRTGAGRRRNDSA